MKKLLLLLALATPLVAQNTRWDLQTLTTQGQGGNLLPVFAIPGAKISFYNMPGLTLANTYNSATSVSACPTNAQVVLQGSAACVNSADPQGNFGAWFLSGQYRAVITASGRSYNYDFSIATGGGGGGGIPTSPANALVKINGSNGAASSVIDDGTTVSTTEPLCYTNTSYNAKCGGANGDLRYVNACSITAPNHTLTCSGASFVAGDAGKSIYVSGAGTASGTLLTTIATVTSGTVVQLTAASITTSGTAHIAYGTDDTSALNAGYVTAGTAGKAFYIPAGNYLHHGLNFTNSQTSIYGDGGVQTNLYAFVATTGTGVDLSSTMNNSVSKIGFYGGGFGSFWTDYFPKINVLAGRATSGTFASSIDHSFVDNIFQTAGVYNVVLFGYEQTDFLNDVFHCFNSGCLGNLYLSAANTPSFTSAFVTLAAPGTSMTKVNVSGAKTVFDGQGKMVVFDQGSSESIYMVSIRDAYLSFLTGSTFLSDTGSGALRQIQLENLYAEMQDSSGNAKLVNVTAPAWFWRIGGFQLASGVSLIASPLNFNAGFLDSELMTDNTGNSGSGIELNATSCAGSFLHLGQQQPTTNCTDYATKGNIAGYTSGMQANGGNYPSYAFPLTSSGGTQYVKLGTWVSAASGDSFRLSLAYSNGASSAGGQQQWGEIVATLGNNAAAPNLTGLTYTYFGTNPAIPALKMAATGGSTSVGNASWDLWVNTNNFSYGNYTVHLSPGSTWTPIGTTGTPPVGAYVVAGTVTSGVGGSGNTTSTSLTTGTLPVANGANSIVDSHLSQTSSQLTFAGSGSFNSDGSTANATFSSLPSCSTNEGQRAAVQDSTTGVWGATVTGGGSTHVQAYCNGTNWTVMGSAGSAAVSWSCQPGQGDGLNAIPAGTYLTTTCRNESGATVTLTAIRCVSDNSGTSTCNATNGAGTALLTGAITATPTYANGTQSGTTTIASGDFIKITYVADGTSKQIGIDFAGHN